MEAPLRRTAPDLEAECLRDVAHACWAIYQKAADAYRVLSHHAVSDRIRALWRSMAEGLNRQVLYWRRVSEFVQDNPGLEALGNPYEVLERLRDVEARIDRIQESSRAIRSVLDYFHLAYSIEVQLVHPTLQGLPESLLAIPGREGAKWDYATNLRQFLSGLREHCEEDPFHEALADSLERMWAAIPRSAAQEPLDPVTGAYTGGLLRGVISAFSNLAERDGHNIAILLIGIENLNELYTRFGLKAGDDVVRRFYTGIKPILRVSDVIGRYNFSTFLVYLSKVNHQYLYDIAQRLADSAQAIQRPGFVLSIHIGGSYGPIRAEETRQPESYLTRAWDCLLRARLSRSQRVLIE